MLVVALTSAIILHIIDMNVLCPLRVQCLASTVHNLFGVLRFSEARPLWARIRIFDIPLL